MYTCVQGSGAVQPVPRPWVGWLHGHEQADRCRQQSGLWITYISHNASAFDVRAKYRMCGMPLAWPCVWSHSLVAALITCSESVLRSCTERLEWTIYSFCPKYVFGASHSLTIRACRTQSCSCTTSHAICSRNLTCTVFRTVSCCHLIPRVFSQFRTVSCCHLIPRVFSHCSLRLSMSRLSRHAQVCNVFSNIHARNCCCRRFTRFIMLSIPSLPRTQTCSRQQV